LHPSLRDYLHNPGARGFSRQGDGNLWAIENLPVRIPQPHRNDDVRQRLLSYSQKFAFGMVVQAQCPAFL
jgi:hypothetical protein